MNQPFAKKGRQRPRQAEKLYQTIVQTARDGFWLVDAQGRLLEVNDAYCQMTGYTREQLLKMTIQDVEAEETAQDTAHHIQRIMETGADHFETKHRCADGRLIDIDVNVNHLDSNGDHLLVVFLSDITERKRAEEELLHRIRHINVLYTIDHAASQSLDLREVINRGLDATLAALGMESGGIFLLEPDGQTMRLDSHRGLSDEFARNVAQIKLGEGVSGQAAALRTPVVLNVTDYPTERLAPFILQEGLQTMASTPLVSAGEVLGALNLGTRRVRAFPPEEMDLLTSIGQQLGGVVRNALLHESLQQSLDTLEKSLEGTVRAIARVGEMKDPFTAGHQQKVSQLAGRLTQEMGLSPHQVDGVRMAGLLHDIGKITIPAEILSKPGRLTPLEYEFVKTHSQAGHDMLAAVTFPWPIAQLVLQHHERIDGSGYPSGLSGEGIALEARILALADVVEAMSSHRPYRPAFNIDSALLEVSRNRGVLYDSQVADVCLKMFIDNGFKFE